MTNEPDPATSDTPKNFEDALAQLEAIVAELEGGELALEASLARYEHGVRLARFCSGKLEEAEKRIELLQTDEEGEPVTDRDGEPRKTQLELD